MATLSTLRTRVANNFGGRTDKNTQIDLFLNMAVTDASVAHDFNDLWTTDGSGALAVTDYTEALPATIRKVEAVFIKDASNNYWNPKIVGRTSFREMWPEIIPSDSGPSSECFIAGRTIYFSHKADVAYTIYIDGYKYPTEMTADGNSPSISGIDDFLVAQATGYLYMHLKQMEEAMSWFNIATIKLKERSDEIGPPIGQITPW